MPTQRYVGPEDPTSHPSAPDRLRIRCARARVRECSSSVWPGASVHRPRIRTIELSDTVKKQLPAGEYDIEVKLAGTSTTVLSLLDAEIPEGANVEIIAKRTGKLTADLDGIGLKIKVK